MPYKKMSRRPRRKIARRRVAKRARVSKTIKRYVKRAISTAAENKFNIVQAVNQAITTANGTTPFNFSILPALASGSNRYSRSANSVRVKKLIVSGRINLLPHNATTNPVACPLMAKIWFLSVKPYNEIGAFSGSPAATGFFDGATGPIGFSGNILDMLGSVSEDFKVYSSKTITLGTSAATNNFPSTSVGAYTSNQYSAPFYFNAAKHLKSALKYNDTSSSSIPQNRNMFCCIQVVAADGSSTTVTGAECAYNIRTEFEDM